MPELKLPWKEIKKETIVVSLPNGKRIDLTDELWRWSENASLKEVVASIVNDNRSGKISYVEMLLLFIENEIPLTIEEAQYIHRCFERRRKNNNISPNK